MLHHASFLVRSLDDVHAAAKRFRERGVPIMCGPGRHPPSGSAFIYFLDPDGLTLEYSHGMEHIAEIAPRQPRVLPPVPESLDFDANPRDPRIYTVGEIETLPPPGQTPSVANQRLVDGSTGFAASGARRETPRKHR